MTRADVKQEIRRQISCTDYLEKSKGKQYCCPFCGSGHGASGTGALHLYKTNTWTCFSCHESGDVIDLYRHETGADYNTALSILADQIGLTIDPYTPDTMTPQEPRRAPETPLKDKEHTNKPATSPAAKESPADYTEYYKQCKERLTDPAAKAYLEGRGISIETAAAYWIGFDPQADPASAPGKSSTSNPHPCPRIIIPTNKGHYVGRRIDSSKDFAKINAAGSRPGIFNRRALFDPEAKEIFVCEGAFDALSLLEAGFNAIALNSAGNVGNLLDELTAKRTAATLILCPDNDSDPKTAATIKREFDELAAGLQRLNISHIRADINAGCKDANEALTADRAAFIEAAEGARQKAAQKPDNVTYYINNLMGDEIKRFKTDVQTGYSNLDAEARGLYTGLYIVAAISSLGKTTFCHQLADQLAEAGQDVLFFSLEQSRLEMVSKSFARRIAKRNPDSGITSLAIRKGCTQDAVKTAAKEYIESVGEKLSIIEGNFACNISFIGDYIRQYMRRNPDSRPIVFIDYLQVLEPATDEKGHRQTTKETIDTTIIELKRISRELDLTIFAISSVNRANYLTPIDFESLKESGGIEFTADVVWGLQLQCLNEPIFEKANNIKERRERVKQAKRETPRKIELVCLKNRYGIANFSCYFDYYPAADLFEPTIEPDLFERPRTKDMRL